MKNATMGNNILSIAAGALSSFLGMIVGWISVDSIIEIAVLGFVGGVTGLLGKWLVQHVRAKLSKRYHWIKPAKKENAKV